MRDRKFYTEKKDPVELTLCMDEFLPLRDVVFKTIRQGILTGQLEAGQRLMEVQLSNQLGVSRTPIREAIRMLELEGLVITLPRKGAHVASITQGQVQDVLEVRRALETLAIARACERITVAGTKVLIAAQEAFEEATLSHDPETIAQADVAFHNVILLESHNERLISLVNNISEVMYRYRFEYIRDMEVYDPLIQEHRLLCEAICRQDVETAVELIRIHIDNQEIGIYQYLGIKHY